MNTLIAYAEYVSDFSHVASVAEYNANDCEDRHEALSDEYLEAAEHGMTVAELRNEYAIQARDARLSQNYRALQRAAWADLVNPS